MPKAVKVTSRLGIWIIALLMLSGCGTRQQTLERLGLAHTKAFDLAEGDQIRMSYAIPRIERQRQWEETITVTARTPREGRIKADQQTNWILVTGQVRVLLFGETLLRKHGVSDRFDLLVRDPSMSPRARLALVNDKAVELLDKKYPKFSRTGRYIDQLLQKEAYVHAIPDVSIYRFTRDLEEEGIDPVMPVIRDDGERIVLDGIGLFKDDRYAGKVNVDEANIFMLMYENFRRGKLFVQVDEQERLMMDSVINRRKVTVRRTREGYEVRLRLKVRGAIMEYEGPAELVNGTHLRQLEQRVAQNIAQRCETVIRQMQEFGSDALGIGRFVRNSGTYAQWKKLNWREEFPKVDIRCEVRVQFNNIGKYSKSG